MGIRNDLRLVKAKFFVPCEKNMQKINPLAADLPERQRAKIEPYSNVGVNYSGSFIVKIGGTQEKPWCCCLFTYSAIRAVQIDIAHNVHKCTGIGLCYALTVE